MNIAVLFGEIGFISRSRIIDGIRFQAKEDKSNVFLFTCEGFAFQDLEEYILGEYNIYSLPDFDMYDGIVVDIDSIQNKQTADLVRERIKASGKPCVSFNEKIGNSDVIEFDNEQGFRKLTDHLIKEHNIRNFYYLSGPSGNRDAVQRRDIFISELKKNGIDFPEENIFYGNFDYESGCRLVRRIIDSGMELPEAFVAANDYMAIGIMAELKKRNISVPDQVIVTGYDNCELADCSIPRITAVDRGEYESGVLAFSLLRDRIEHNSDPCNHVIYGKPVFSDSCGCLRGGKLNFETNMCVDIQMTSDASMDLLKGLAIEFSNMDDMECFGKSMEKYISRMSMEFFYFCQCGSRESYYNELDEIAAGDGMSRDVTKFMDTAWCPIAYESGRWKSYPSFDVKNLFPPNSKYKKEDSYYIIMPVHQGRVCIGYIIVGNFRENISGRVIQHLVLNIDQAIGNIRKQDIKKTMLARINKKWQYDELTGLYNRSGLQISSGKLIEDAVSNDFGISVMFFDLDGLKKVNDIQGHKAGDRYIKSMADILISAKDKDDIAVRYGGDEYVIISSHSSEEEGLRRFEEIKSCITDPVSASAGFSYKKISEVIEIKELIEKADKEMYEDKKKRKKLRTD